MARSGATQGRVVPEVGGSRVDAGGEAVTVEQVPVARLSLHPENPRRGNVAAIQDSISAHGFGVDANAAYVAVTLQRLAGLGLEPRREPVARRRKPAAKPQPAAK